MSDSIMGITENGFDPDREIARSIAEQQKKIASKARDAVDRIFWMHAVGSGVCVCGESIKSHPSWGPVEMPMDKSELI